MRDENHGIGGADVDHDRRDTLGDGEGHGVGGLARPTRQVDCDRGCVEVRDEPIPEAGGRAAPVNEDDRRIPRHADRIDSPA